MSEGRIRNTVVFQIASIACSNCVRTTATLSQSIEGVLEVGTDYILHRAHFNCDSSTVSPKAIRKMMEEADYRTFPTQAGTAV